MSGGAGTDDLVGALDSVDVADRHHADEYAYRLAAIVESSDDAILSKDLNGIITSWNGGAERLFGYTPAEVIGKSILILIPPDRHAEEVFILERIRRGERVRHLETIRRRKDGSMVEISLTVSPVKDDQGRLIGVSKIARDISDRRRAQIQQQLLLNEMKHRVKNVLSIVQAIASQTLHSATPVEKDAFFGRLGALAQAQDLLSQDSWNSAAVPEIVARALAPFQEKHADRISIEGDGDAWLPSAKVSLLAMGLHELATNAVKYGALSNTTGRVHVSWQKTGSAENTRIHVEWKETGGPPVSPPERKGFGMRLLEHALDGDLGKVSLELDPAGLVCRVEIRT